MSEEDVRAPASCDCLQGVRKLPLSLYQLRDRGVAPGARVYVESDQPGLPAHREPDVGERVQLPPAAYLPLVRGRVLQTFARARVLAGAPARLRVDAGAAAVRVRVVKGEDGPAPARVGERGLQRPKGLRSDGGALV